MTGTTNAAVASIKVSQKVLESDSLLSIILSLTNPFQVSIEILTKSKNVELELWTQDNTVKTTQRNAVIRSLCGMTLHNALDRKYFLLGGCATGSDAGLEDSVFITSAITSWMSVAATATSDDDIPKLIDHLDSNVLERQSFLVRSPGVTLADLDVFFMLKKHEIGEDKVNISRWFRQVHASTLYLLADDRSARPDIAKYVKLEDLPAVRSSAPVFFYGNADEQQVQLPSFPSSKKKAVAPDNIKKVESKSCNTAADSSKETSKSTAPKTNELTEEQKKAAAEKKAKKAAEKAAKKKKTAPPPTPAAELNISALDIRVGKITKVWNHETADKLYCEEIDLGESTPRNIASGLRPFYSLEDLDQQMVLVLCNLKARSLVGFSSHGMVICASSEDHTKVQFVIPPEGSKVGERVVFEGYEEGEPESESRVNKKKIFEALAPFLKTDKNGGLIWKEAKGGTSSGQCFAIQKMPDAHVS